MRAISKGREPRSLVEHRANTHSHYGNYDDTDGLRAALVREQRGLCCYCMRRIEATRVAMKIEHWRCQSRYPEHDLAYSNLLAACLGGHGQPEDKQHCDTRKGERDLKFNPSDPAHHIEQRIRFELNGTIASSDDDFNKELCGVLNLNLKSLKNSRKAVVDGLTGWLREYRAQHHRGPDNATLRRKRDQWTPTNGDLRPFAQVAVWWIDQRLAPSTA